MNTQHRPIFIIGYMACGKTTFGRALARRLGREFIDLDFYIEQRFRKSISEIFGSRGEEGFRRIEKEMLHETGEMLDVVVACGGGTPCFFDNMDYMLQQGKTVYLDTSQQRIVERLMRNRSRRPLMAGKDDEAQIRRDVEAGIKSRLEYYMRAEIVHTGEHLETRSQIDLAVDDFIRTNGI